MDITIGMKRERIEKLRDELTGALARTDRVIDITIYGKVNTAGSEEAIITLGNDDMERDDVSVDDIYVDVD